MNLLFKIKRLIKWTKLLWNLEYSYIGLYKVISMKLKDMTEDLPNLDSFQMDKIKTATVKLDKITSGSSKIINSDLASATECIRKHSLNWI